MVNTDPTLQEQNLNVTPQIDTKEEVSNQQNPQEGVDESPSAVNFRRFRKEREAERKRMADREKEMEQEKLSRERERHAQETQIKAMEAAMEALLKKQNNPDDLDINEKELQEKRVQDLVRAELERVRKIERDEAEAREQASIRDRILSVHPDFNEVCTQENLDYVDFHEPEMSKAFQSAKNDMNKWLAIYKFVKKTIPNPMSKKDERRMEQNDKKPRSISIPGLTETGDSAPSILSDQRKKDNWARMRKVMQG